MGTRCANHVTPLYPQKLALTSPTGGGLSVGMVCSRTKATEFSLRPWTVPSTCQVCYGPLQLYKRYIHFYVNWFYDAVNQTRPSSPTQVRLLNAPQDFSSQRRVLCCPVCYNSSASPQQSSGSVIPVLPTFHFLPLHNPTWGIDHAH